MSWWCRLWYSGIGNNGGMHCGSSGAGYDGMACIVVVYRGSAYYGGTDCGIVVQVIMVACIVVVCIMVV